MQASEKRPFSKQKQSDVVDVFFFPHWEIVTFSKKNIPNECMKLTYHTHCTKRPGCLTTCLENHSWKRTKVLVMRGKGQQVLFFSIVFTEELSSNAEIAELFI